MATLTLLSDTGHHQQQQNGHHHAKKKCTSATCCSPSRIWKSIQQLIADNNKQDLIKLCQDPNKASHVLRVILSSRLTNDASLYPASNKHRVIQLVDDGSSGLSPLHYRATVNTLFGKTATDLNALQLALFHRNESIACYLLQSVRQYAGDKEVKLFVNHLWGTRNGSLHLACFLGMPRVVQLLLEMGVAPDAVNGKLKTPLDCCVDLTAVGSGGQASILDCRTLIEQALLIKQGKKLSVDSSSPSPSADLCVSPTSEHNVRGTHVDAEVNKNECVVDNKMEIQGNDDRDVVDASSSTNDAIEFGREEVSARVIPSSALDTNGQDEFWSLPLLLMDSPFGSGDPFASDDELWSPPLLIMDSSFASGDPFVSDDDSFDAGDESWSPPLLIMDNPFGSDPFMCEDYGSDGITCSMDDVETQTKVLPLPIVVEKCSARDSGGNGGVALVTNDYSDYGYDGNSSGTSEIHSFVDPSDHGNASVSPPTLDGDSPLAGHSSLLFGMNEDPDPKAYGNHQVHSDPGMANVATYLRGNIRDPDPTKTAHDSDTSWSLSSHYDGTGDTRNRSVGHSFVEQDTNFMSTDRKALRYESTLAERKTSNVIAGANGCVGYEDNPNTDRLLLMIARALHTTARPLPFAPLKPCNSDYRTILGTHGLDHRPSFMAVAGGDT